MSRVEECKDNLLLKAGAPQEGYRKIVGRGEKGLKHLEFGLLRLTSGEWSGGTGDCEHGLDIYSGVIALEADTPNGKLLRERLGGRRDAFDGLPTMIYLPPGTSYRIKVIKGPAEIAVFSAAAPGFKADAAIIGPEDTVKASVGKDNWRREVYTSIGDSVQAAKLLLGETINPAGNWSSSPPHKHDTLNPPGEAPLEEIYYFQVSPAQGYGIIRVYTQLEDPSPLNEIYVVENGDTVVIPRGYHPVAAAPGYVLHYTWVLAGEVRKYGAWSDDPRHAWLKNT